jgi:hypothetical protein
MGSFAEEAETCGNTLVNLADSIHASLQKADNIAAIEATLRSAGSAAAECMQASSAVEKFANMVGEEYQSETLDAVSVVSRASVEALGLFTAARDSVKKKDKSGAIKKIQAIVACTFKASEEVITATTMVIIY